MIIIRMITKILIVILTKIGGDDNYTDDLIVVSDG